MQALVEVDDDLSGGALLVHELLALRPVARAGSRGELCPGAISRHLEPKRLADGRSHGRHPVPNRLVDGQARGQEPVLLSELLALFHHLPKRKLSMIAETLTTVYLLDLHASGGSDRALFSRFTTFLEEYTVKISLYG